MEKLKIVTICPDDTYFTWQVHLWLESLKERGLSNKALVLIFVSRERKANFERQKETKWQPIISLYPEAEIVFYHDEHGIQNLLPIYIPVLRPYTAWRYWQDHPEMNNKTIFYCDSDILFMDNFDLSPFLNDEICYLSDTKGYINANYFDSKIKDVQPHLIEAYKKIDVLDNIAKLIGVNREVCVANNENSGGAQYLMKKVDAKFWQKVMRDSITIRTQLQDYNKRYFVNENKGFQSWAADMWAVLWNLWVWKKETKIVKELDFSWATDPIYKLDKCPIFHNAGLNSIYRTEKRIVNNEETTISWPNFYKGKYSGGSDPMKDPLIDEILNNEESKKYCTYYYTQKVKELKDKYKLEY